MQAIIGKAPQEWTDAVGITEIVICPEHPQNFMEIYLNHGELPDASEFCDCCTGDCSSFCRNCNN